MNYFFNHGYNRHILMNQFHNVGCGVSVKLIRNHAKYFHISSAFELSKNNHFTFYVNIWDLTRKKSRISNKN